GEEAPSPRHFAVFMAANAAPVGCASFMAVPFEGAPAFQLRGMATRATCVRRGVGTALLRAAEPAVVGESGVRLLWCNARLAAVPFYRRLRWEGVSDVFDVSAVAPPHTVGPLRLAGL